MSERVTQPTQPPQPRPLPSPPLERLDAEALRRWPLPVPEAGGDKESRGCVLIVAGGREMPGAALLAARAALHAGAGKVMVGTARSVAVALAVALPELRVVGLPETEEGAIDGSRAATWLADRVGSVASLLIGPGLQDEAASLALTHGLLARFDDVPVVLDAAAMAAADSHAGRRAPVLITPHAGEMAHLSSAAKAAIQDDPLGHARAMAAERGAIVAAKGASTVLVHPDGRGWQHDAGAIGLGTAGSGDVLAGLIAGLAARGAALEQAAAWGIVLHGLAGGRLSQRIGPLGFLASALSAEVPGLLGSFGESPA